MASGLTGYDHLLKSHGAPVIVQVMLSLSKILCLEVNWCLPRLTKTRFASKWSILDGHCISIQLVEPRACEAYDSLLSFCSPGIQLKGGICAFK